MSFTIVTVVSYFGCCAQILDAKFLVQFYWQIGAFEDFCNRDHCSFGNDTIDVPLMMVSCDLEPFDVGSSFIPSTYLVKMLAFILYLSDINQIEATRFLNSGSTSI